LVIDLFIKHLTELEEKVLGSIKSGGIFTQSAYPVQFLSIEIYFYFTGIEVPFNRGFEQKKVKDGTGQGS